jgi:hypothetical protein
MTNYLKCLGLLLCLAGGCDDDTTAPADASIDASASKEDLSAPAMLSQCGHPGDTGNSLGVGEYCVTSDGPSCPAGKKANACSAIVNDPAKPSPDDSYFCTFFCSATDPPGTCGEDARCICRGVQCICIPNRCNNTDAGT